MAANLKDTVAEVLARRILDGTYPPGAPLPAEATLLAEFSVSRTCLREALQRLGAKGLVEARPKRGTTVNPPLDWNFLDSDMLRWRQAVTDRRVLLRELFTVRRLIEPETARLAALNRSEDDVAEMQMAVERMALGRGSRTPDTIEADVVFHRLLLKASGNALLSGLGACIEEALRASIRITSDPGLESPFALEEHLLVFEAVRERRAEDARRHMTRLLDLTEGALDRLDAGEVTRDGASAPLRDSSSAAPASMATAQGKTGP